MSTAQMVLWFVAPGGVILVLIAIAFAHKWLPDTDDDLY